MDKHLNNIYSRLKNLEDRMDGIFQVLQEIVGKELLRGQALHKVLMDKAIFTDQELKAALEKLMEESKADLEKLEAEAKEAKAKAVELLVPAGANLKPPVDLSTGTPAPSEHQTPNSEQPVEAPNAEPPATKG